MAGSSSNCALAHDLPHRILATCKECFCKQACCKQAGASMPLRARLGNTACIATPLWTSERALAQMKSLETWKLHVLNPDKLRRQSFKRSILGSCCCRYAKVSRDERLKWHDLTKTYFEQRKSLAQVFLLIDAGHPPQAIDVECASWLAETKVGVMFFVRVPLGRLTDKSV